MRSIPHVHARRALLALAVGGFGIGTGEFAAAGVLPEIAGSTHVSIPTAGDVISTYALGVVVGAPILAAVTVKLPRKGLLIALAVTMALGNILSAVAPTFATLAIARFLCGLPHGAYFGIASVVASSLVPAERRSSAMAVVFGGLTVANIVGVPLTTLIGQNASWRWSYATVGVIQALAAVAVLVAVPHPDPDSDAPEPHIRHELRAFRNPLMWLTLATPMIGGAGMFATISYIAPMLEHVAGYPKGAVTYLLVLFGVGMTAGNLLGARLADRAILPTIFWAFAVQIACGIAFFFAAHNEVTAALMLFVFPLASLSSLPGIQSRVVQLAGDAPNLAAASVQAAFNVANSIGAWAGGAAIAAGWGYSSPNLVAAGLAAIGTALAFATWRLDLRPRRLALASR